jgi:hypothetical protein
VESNGNQPLNPPSLQNKPCQQCQQCQPKPKPNKAKVKTELQLRIGSLKQTKKLSATTKADEDKPNPTTFTKESLTPR